MSGTEEASALSEGAAPDFTRRKYHRYHLRRFRFAAFVAAIFVFADSTQGAAATFQRMSANVVQASGSFTSLISTVLWFFGACFVINGAFKLYRAVKRPPDDPVKRANWRQGILYVFLSLGCLSFPFFQDTAVESPAYVFSGYMSPRIVEEHGASLKAFSVLCWYFCLAFLLNADVNFRAALRLKGDPAAARLRVKTAIYALMGFAFLAAPAICSFYER